MASAMERAANYMDKEMIEPMRQKVIGRKLFAKVINLPKGKYNVDVDRISEMNGASIGYGMPSTEATKDAVNISKENFRLPFLWKDYDIERSDFEAYASEGIKLDTASMLSAMQTVAVLEDTLLFQGWKPDGTNYAVKGLYQIAGQSYTTSKDFATFGNPTVAVSAARTLLWKQNVNGVNFNLVLNPDQFAELDASMSQGIDEMPKVLSLLNPVPGAMPGTVLQSIDIATGTGLMAPVDTAGQYFDLVKAVDARNEFGVDSKHPETSPLFGRVYESLFPRVKQSNAFCTLTAI